MGGLDGLASVVASVDRKAMGDTICIVIVPGLILILFPIIIIIIISLFVDVIVSHELVAMYAPRRILQRCTCTVLVQGSVEPSDAFQSSSGSALKLGNQGPQRRSCENPFIAGSDDGPGPANGDEVGRRTRAEPNLQ